MPDFSRRATEPELMDLPDADPVRLLRTVAQFRLINRLFSASGTLLERHVIGEARRRGLAGFSFLDIGAGGCDLPIRLVRRCRRLKLAAAVTCIDHDRRIIAHAEQVCRPFPEIRILARRVEDLAELGTFDFVFANNFLHHLPDAAIAPVLAAIARSARIGFLINDIHRSRAAWLGYSIFAGLFLHRSFAFFDGRLSVRKGFRPAELAALADKAGLAQGVRIERHRPARIIMLGQTDSPASPGSGPVRKTVPQAGNVQ
jgi:2-polyprenyl-3-methyl-5-hydroxy-6-metoxy-1,4-benzoquinol methylase